MEATHLYYRVRVTFQCAGGDGPRSSSKLVSLDVGITSDGIAAIGRMFKFDSIVDYRLETKWRLDEWRLLGRKNSFTGLFLDKEFLCCLGILDWLINKNLIVFIKLKLFTLFSDVKITMSTRNFTVSPKILKNIHECVQLIIKDNPKKDYQDNPPISWIN